MVVVRGFQLNWHGGFPPKEPSHTHTHTHDEYPSRSSGVLKDDKYVLCVEMNGVLTAHDPGSVLRSC